MTEPYSLRLELWLPGSLVTVHQYWDTYRFSERQKLDTATKNIFCYLHIALIVRTQQLDFALFVRWNFGVLFAIECIQRYNLSPFLHI